MKVKGDKLTTMHIGIDPGCSGAIAFLRDPGTGQLGAQEIRIEWCPTMVVSRRKTSYIPGMVGWLKMAVSTGCPVRAWLEKVHSFPGAGVASMFSFGENFGAWQGALAACDIPYSLVEPSRWKRLLLADLGKAKDAARLRAAQLWPLVKQEFVRIKDHGKAEALLIAEYGRRQTC